MKHACHSTSGARVAERVYSPGRTKAASASQLSVRMQLHHREGGSGKIWEIQQEASAIRDVWTDLDKLHVPGPLYDEESHLW